MEPSGAYRHAHYSDGPFFHPKDAIRHNRDILGAWTMFILDKSEGLTQAGVERLDDSIRTYVWVILGAQAQTRSEHSQGRDGVRCTKAVPGQRRRRHRLARRHLQQHRSIAKDVPVCLDPSGLRLWDWALPRPERHCPPPGQCPGLQ